MQFYACILITGEDTAIVGHKIPFPRTMRREFKEMRTKFGSTFYNVRLLFAEKQHKNKKKALNKMKSLIIDCFPDLESQLSHRNTIDGVLDVLKRKCSIVDVHPLEVLAVEFKIKEAETIIKSYKEIANDFRNSVSLSLCIDERLQAVPITHLLCETITFVLNWNADEATLQDINDVLLDLEPLQKYHIQLYEIRRHLSVAVTCYCPAEYTGSLITTVLEKIEILQKRGLKEFIVGNGTIWKNTDDKVS